MPFPRTTIAAAVLAALAIAASNGAHAIPAAPVSQFTLGNVSWADGSSATGTFGYNTSINQVTAVTIAYTSGAGSNGYGPVPATSFTTASTTITYMTLNGTPDFTFDNGIDSLTFLFTAPLGTAPVGLLQSVNAYTTSIHEDANPNIQAQNVSPAATISPVAEPASLLILGAGLVGTALFRRQRTWSLAAIRIKSRKLTTLEAAR